MENVMEVNANNQVQTIALWCIPSRLLPARGLFLWAWRRVRNAGFPYPSGGRTLRCAKICGSTGGLHKSLMGIRAEYRSVRRSGHSRSVRSSRFNSCPRPAFLKGSER